MLGGNQYKEDSQRLSWIVQGRSTNDEKEDDATPSQERATDIVMHPMAIRTYILKLVPN